MAALSVIEQLIKHRLPDRPAPPEVAVSTETITDLQAFFQKQETLVNSFENKPKSVADLQEISNLVSPAQTETRSETTSSIPSVLDQIRSQLNTTVASARSQVTTEFVSPSPTYSYADIAPAVQDRILSTDGTVESEDEVEVVREVRPAPRTLFGGQLVL